MILFILTQLLGMIIFMTVSFGVFCFLLYKRNKLLNLKSKSRYPLWYRIGIVVISIVFVGTLAFRLLNVTDTLKGVEGIQPAPVKAEKDIIKL